MRTILKNRGTRVGSRPRLGRRLARFGDRGGPSGSGRRRSRSASAPFPRACAKSCSMEASPWAWPEPRDGVYSDRYEIAGVTKLDGDRWRFDARITYGDVDVTLPVVVPILWAGDVPMIRMVDVEIPGLGSEFGATVVFDG